MVKSIVILILIVLLALSGCIYLTVDLNNRANELIDMVHVAQEYRLQDDLDNALQTLNTLSKTWDDTESFWSILCNHEDVYLITSTIARAVIACEQRNTEQLEIECAELILAIKNIPHKENVRIENIL